MSKRTYTSLTYRYHVSHYTMHLRSRHLHSGRYISLYPSHPLRRICRRAIEARRHLSTKVHNSTCIDGPNMAPHSRRQGKEGQHFLYELGIALSGVSQRRGCCMIPSIREIKSQKELAVGCAAKLHEHWRDTREFNALTLHSSCRYFLSTRHPDNGGFRVNANPRICMCSI